MAIDYREALRLYTKRVVRGEVGAAENKCISPGPNGLASNEVEVDAATRLAVTRARGGKGGGAERSRAGRALEVATGHARKEEAADDPRDWRCRGAVAAEERRLRPSKRTGPWTTDGRHRESWAAVAGGGKRRPLSSLVREWQRRF
ncbi:hypothetical protein J5N97_004001 [Dioscorea zingiberensis]|uniref:Uncharacterized protein n=1 Tax=Dioscorea zingiberensis TaxID=325984 RepID=A0A9D5D7S6_9LILI|nr:hypothetical protein J5N97_004001 [Dioscorea zingiberensis]